MSKPPIIIAMERRKKISNIIRQCLQPYGLESTVSESELHVREAFIAEFAGYNTPLSRAVLDTMFPHEPVPSTLYHYTSLEGLAAIATSGELRLYPIRNRLGQGGELEAFAKAHSLDKTPG